MSIIQVEGGASWKITNPDAVPSILGILIGYSLVLLILEYRMSADPSKTNAKIDFVLSLLIGVGALLYWAVQSVLDLNLFERLVSLGQYALAIYGMSCLFGLTLAFWVVVRLPPRELVGPAIVFSLLLTMGMWIDIDYKWVAILILASFLGFLPVTLWLKRLDRRMAEARDSSLDRPT